MTPEQEATLLRAWSEDRDVTARNRLVEAYLPLVASVIARFRWAGQSTDELTSAGTVGLMRAIDKFDPSRGVRFATYAQYWIRAAVGDQVRGAAVVGGLRSETRCVAGDRSLDAPRADGRIPLDELADPSQGVDEVVAAEQTQRRLRAEVASALQNLTVRERFIVERRLMAEADRRLTLAQIGAIFGTSREWVRRLEVGAKAKLRRRLAPLAA